MVCVPLCFRSTLFIEFMEYKLTILSAVGGETKHTGRLVDCSKTGLVFPEKGKNQIKFGLKKELKRDFAILNIFLWLKRI